MNTTQPQKRIKVCRCGQEFTVETRNQKSCPACIEAKRAAEAAQLPVVCKKCGELAYDCKHRVCGACRLAAAKQRLAEVKEMRKRDLQQRLDARTEKEEPAPTQPAAQDDDSTDPATDLAAALFLALIPFLGEPKAKKPKAPPTVEEVLPEWVDHVEQDRIDAIASRLLEEWGIEL